MDTVSADTYGLDFFSWWNDTWTWVTISLVVVFAPLEMVGLNLALFAVMPLITYLNGIILFVILMTLSILVALFPAFGVFNVMPFIMYPALLYLVYDQ